MKHTKRLFIFVSSLLLVFTLFSFGLFAEEGTEACSHSSLTHHYAKKSTCTRVGNIEFWQCDSCGKYFTNEKCTIEVSRDDVILPLSGHTWVKSETLVEPSYYQTGSRKLTCSCGYQIIETLPINNFTDVTTTDYFYDAVRWAVDEEITEGTSATTFSPGNSCTRGQVVTFLWRAAGSPKNTIANPFSDISKNDYYYDAVLWALENNITMGIDETHFCPSQSCTRGQIVTFIYRWSDDTFAASTENPFKDVEEDAFYYDSVLWAVENEITSGMTENTFGPGSTCDRGQVVTFIYRYMN